uniref:Uncharacterized protein n=1 Tax=Triticum urartu TaxID=4572 RepID=A0A8R7TK64_TRIUA
MSLSVVVHMYAVIFWCCPGFHPTAFVQMAGECSGF